MGYHPEMYVFPLKRCDLFLRKASALPPPPSAAEPKSSAEGL